MSLKNTLTTFLILLLAWSVLSADDRPNIVLVMADDQGWGQMGYYNHPYLKTPNLDAMAAAGLRFDRFYAGGPVCSPTRASVMSGRTHNRTGVWNHGAPYRLQETTIAHALKDLGYATGHFGKWHLNGIRGPGVPVLGDDVTSPGALGFEHWLTVTNFFDIDPVMSRMGKFEEFKGDSSEVIVGEALKYMKKQKEGPFFTVIWYGSPHDPMVASDEDRAPFAHLTDKEQHHYGELVALDRSIGTLRKGLRDMGIADNTLIWYCSDNGGLPPFGPATVGGLRGFKGSMWEGGLRVPGIIEWPDVIKKSRVIKHPAGVVDMFPTVLDILGHDLTPMLQPNDGMSILHIIEGDASEVRPRPLGFHSDGRAAIIDNDYKLVVENIEDGIPQLFDLIKDPKESKNIFYEEPGVASDMMQKYIAFNDSVQGSIRGEDYPEGHVNLNQPPRLFWWEMEEYEPFFDEWAKRPEYAPRLRAYINSKK
ncbi:MAG: sulfatase-like hydrolase/transferase [Opitutales bacterium]|jgi:arylsulfatase A-like enzyme|nr:sulfatase-like hydrolase/transferase [Opitutales bacterium]